MRGETETVWDSVARCARDRRAVLLGAVVAGLLATSGPPLVALVVAAGAAVAGAVVWRRPVLALALGAAVLAGAVGGQARLAALDRTELTPLLDRTIAVRAVLLEAPRERRFETWTAPARIVAGRGRGERIVLRGRGRPRGEIGAEVLARGRLERLAEWESYEARRGAHAALEAEAVRLTGRRRGGVAGALDAIRRAAERGVSEGLASPQAALARGMVLGQDDALSEETRDAFRASGLSHVLAASGQNVALLAVLAAVVVAAAGGGLRARLAVALLLVAVYVPLAGAGPSIQRAGVMGAAALVAGLAGRPSSRVHALLLAAAVTLALNPRAAGEPGWQLSFAAVIAIAVLAPRLRRSAALRRLPGPLADGAAMTLAATLGTAPLLALHFERVSLASLPANLVAMPAVAPVVWLGTISGALAQFGSVADPVVEAVNAVAALPLGFVGLVAQKAAGLPHASVPIALGVPAAIGAYAVLFGVVLSRRVRAVACGAMVALAVGVVAVTATARTPAPPDEPTVSFLDVGQGDATLLQDRGVAVLVDTGPPDGPIVERLRAAGVRRLDLLVLTHGEADHAGATARVLDAVGADAVLDGAATAPAGDAREISAAITASGARRLRPVAGRRLRVGPLEMRVLWPSGDEPAPGASPNDRAVVLLVRRGATRMLLAADAESPVLAPLDLPAVDVLKVAHHGSADPGLPALLERLRPDVAAIEVGAENRYGHPAPETLAALRAASVPHIVRTDEDGTIRLTLRERSFELETAR